MVDRPSPKMPNGQMELSLSGRALREVAGSTDENFERVLTELLGLDDCIIVRKLAPGTYGIGLNPDCRATNEPTRWPGRSLGVTIIMNFIDEASPVYNPDGTSQWDNDFEELKQAVRVTSERAMGLFQPGGSDTDILKPDERDFTGVVDVLKSIGRPPSQQELIDEFENLQDLLGNKLDTESLEVQTLILDIDGSGSMTRSDIEPGIDDFKQWVSEEHPEVEVIERVYSNERWLVQSADSLEIAAQYPHRL